MRIKSLILQRLVLGLFPFLTGWSTMRIAAAQDFDIASCDEFLLPLRVLQGQQVGPESCYMQETDVTFQGRPFRRMDIGLNGTVEGYLSKEGQYREYLTNAPHLVFPQTSDPGPVYAAIARYERDKGAAMTILYPLAEEDWNQKMWVTVHGRGRAFALGNLKAWNKNLDRSNLLGDLNRYDRLLLAKGYALVKTYRTSAEGLGEIEATMEDGTQVDFAAFNDSARYILDFTALAEKALKNRLGQIPTRTYFYGHSAGGRIGRGLNYTLGLNLGPDGKPAFDGILADDSAAGTWLPVQYKDGQDVLLTTKAEQTGMVPQLEVTHQMYNRRWEPKTPDWVSFSFLHNKRLNAKILRDKGLTAKHRKYEVRSISHSGGEGLAESGPFRTHILDLSLAMDGFIDILDAWVDQGVEPPVSRSDWLGLGDIDGDGILDNPALAFPEVACPLGVYHQYPPDGGGPGTTFFSAFASQGLEPLDSRGAFVDMNRNGTRDHLETPTQAWQRLGLLEKGEKLTREKFVACIEQAAGSLARDGFFSVETVRSYIEKARTLELNP